jgi:hypothetical protein
MKHIVVPAAVLLLTTAAFILTKSARDGLYFERSGLESLPWAVAGAALLWLTTLWRLRMPAQCEDRSQGAPGIPESCVMTATLGKCMLAGEGAEPACETADPPDQDEANIHRDRALRPRSVERRR